MIFISHRGFIRGPDKNIENNPKQIKLLLDQKINVEIDIYFYNNKFYLGHDEPIYEIKQDFLENNLLWCHAKNYEALEKLKNTKAHFFWHQEDDYTITSKGFVWVYPGKPLIENSICVLPEKHNLDYSKCYGICTDNISEFLNIT
tara:strand:+ start:166 stop:600 length:435 start_codon:yes stop_codon:yes gene_type:complete